MATISTPDDVSGAGAEKGLGSDIDRSESNNGTMAIESLDPAAEKKLLLKVSNLPSKSTAYHHSKLIQ